ncbi:hypothetical protein Vadar_002742 [Vaccinium darrowii]|uniref:Uncharacterized protein n=1 Tax=Vaccinium darrowii TaxID=229202 RepID=A0ACB7XMN5_9ERIC|nr:hypothetical protein Vadar_002742 [Vaccinium darrowii]
MLPNRYLGAVFDIESLVEKLLHQLASKQTILVNVYDTTNSLHPITVYGSNVPHHGFQHVSALNFGDPFRKHEVRCRMVDHDVVFGWLLLYELKKLLSEMVSGFDVIELTIDKHSRTLSNLLWKKLNETVFHEHPIRRLVSKSIVRMLGKFWSVLLGVRVCAT